MRLHCGDKLAATAVRQEPRTFDAMLERRQQGPRPCAASLSERQLRELRAFVTRGESLGCTGIFGHDVPDFKNVLGSWQMARPGVNRRVGVIEIARSR